LKVQSSLFSKRLSGGFFYTVGSDKVIDIRHVKISGLHHHDEKISIFFARRKLIRFCLIYLLEQTEGDDKNDDMVALHTFLAKIKISGYF
jgi:hypothetical protein